MTGPLVGTEVTWTGVDGMMEREFNAMKPKAEKAVLKATLIFEGAVKERLTGTRSGRMYRVPGSKNVMYRASAPGESPASPTGKLRQSITHTLPEWDGDTVSAVVGTKQPQARILEYGGVTGRNGTTRILPRPYWAPAYLTRETDILNALAEATI